jgi:hypothetical protein
MSVTQILETVEDFSSSEILELIEALKERHLKSLEEFHAARLAEVNVYMNDPIVLPPNTPSLKDFYEA